MAAVIASAHTRPAGMPTSRTGESCQLTRCGSERDRIVDSITADQSHDQLRPTIEPHQRENGLAATRHKAINVNTEPTHSTPLCLAVTRFGGFDDPCLDEPRLVRAQLGDLRLGGP